MLLTKRKSNEVDVLVGSIPKAPRSARGKNHRKRPVENDELFAIELLASLAGDLLHENESSSSSNASGSGDILLISNTVKQEKCESVVKTENPDSENCHEIGVARRFELPRVNCEILSNVSGSVENDSVLERCSVVTNPSSKGYKMHDDSSKLPASLNCGNKRKFPRFEGIGNNMFNFRRKNIRKLARDNDERIPKVNRSIFKSKYIGDKRLRKLLTSKYWKVGPKLKDYEHSNPEPKKTLSEDRQFCYNEVYHRDRLYKPISKNSDEGFNSDSSAILCEVNGGSSPDVAHQDSHVKFSIRSIRIPDLLIEVPETASIASLKRTVMEAFTSLVRDGLGVGIVVQGKMVRDDSSTLLQTGITSKENLDTLNFTLEPSLPINPPLQPQSDSLTTSCLVNALVTVPALCEEPLAVIPPPQKSKRSDHVQRRTRRPFSVSEVEALVKAVEELGTGRWRDVKLRSFEDAEHRTYVDLKDKWKTLVHTAKISPQQRRGEPVPQELLDRVLAAHALWSHHPKALPATLRILDSPADNVVT